MKKESFQEVFVYLLVIFTVTEFVHYVYFLALFVVFQTPSAKRTMKRRTTNAAPAAALAAEAPAPRTRSIRGGPAATPAQAARPTRATRASRVSRIAVLGIRIRDEQLRSCFRELKNQFFGVKY